MKIIKNIIVHIIIGILVGILVCTFLVLSPFLACMYMLDWAIRFEDENMHDNYVYDSTIYVSERGIEWDAVRP